MPQILSGDVRSEKLGLDATARARLAGCEVVLHSAASLTFRRSPDGEPWATNVEGTPRLLACCRELGIGNFHHVSTAFACGETPDLVLEDDLERERLFQNVYEQSKWEAEQLIRGTPGLRATFYRPSIIIGDSRTGYTSTYHGIYRFVELAARMAEPPNPTGKRDGKTRRLEMRVPFSGQEPRNLVTVDWVAAAIVRLVLQPAWHGRTFHLTSPSPVPSRLITEVGGEVMNVEGFRFAGAEGITNPSPLEQLFLDHLEEYWTYLGGDPRFDRRNVAAALPDLPPPPIDRALLRRLFEFAAADHWGRKRRGRPSKTKIKRQSNCRRFVEEVLPEAARQASLERQAGLTAVVGLDIRGSEGGQWTCGWEDGRLAFMRPGLEPDTDLFYRMDAATFEDVLCRRRSPQEAFFAQLIEIEGDLEMALKLALMFTNLLGEEQVA